MLSRLKFFSPSVKRLLIQVSQYRKFFFAVFLLLSCLEVLPFPHFEVLSQLSLFILVYCLYRLVRFLFQLRFIFALILASGILALIVKTLPRDYESKLTFRRLAQTQNSDYTFVQFNTHGQVKSYQELFAFMLQEKVHFVFVQEVNNVLQFEKWASQNGYYSVFYERERMGILSKFPVSNPKVAQSLGLLTVEATLANKDKIFLANAHLTRPWPFKKADKTQYQQIETLSSLLNDWHKTKNTPFLLAGDFNSVPWQQKLRDMASTLKMQEVRKPKIHVGTWPALIPKTDIYWNFPFILIDHVYMNQYLEASFWSVDKFLSSDHRPVVVKFRLAAK
jgi:endonuclease/exonuclease/phosphatase (EEP) superfamily protein YafD